jgi:hypothetical protein
VRRREESETAGIDQGRHFFFEPTRHEQLRDQGRHSLRLAERLLPVAVRFFRACIRRRTICMHVVDARAVLLYVVGNLCKHAAQAGRILRPRWVNPFSSVRQLDGWNHPVRLEPGVVAGPRSWLLRVGWRRHGLLDAHAIPIRPR